MSSTVNGSALVLNNTSSPGLNMTGHHNYSGPYMPFTPHLSWGWWMLQVGTPLIVIVGIPGNMVAFIVMKSRRFRGKSYSHYLCTLAVFDSLVLIGKYLHRLDQLLWATGNPSLFSDFGDAACKIHNFTEHVCYLMSSWLVLCMTLERFIAVNFPFKKDLFCKPRNAVTVILVVFAVMSYSQIFRLIVIEKNNEEHACMASNTSAHIYVAMHIYMYQLVLQFLLPAVLILICNMTILVKIKRLRYSVSKHGNTHSMQAYSKRHKTTCMLLIVSFTYVVTLLPLVLLSVIMHISVNVNQDLAERIFRQCDGIKELLELISEINYGINFYIYVMSGAQFRYELRYICSKNYSFISSGAHHSEKVFQFRRSMTS